MNDQGGEADTLLLCKADGCGGVLASSVGFFWCTRCGEKHERVKEIRAK